MKPKYKTKPGSELLSGRTIAEIEREAILVALNDHGGNRTRAARALGITTRTILNKFKRWEEEGNTPAWELDD